MDKHSDPTSHVGFWMRAAALILDCLIILAVTIACLSVLVPTRPEALASWAWADILVNKLFPTAYFLGYWITRQATPGLTLVGGQVVNAQDSGSPTLLQWLERYVSGLASFVLLGIGFVWIAFDAQKQGLHDKASRTMVIKSPARIRHRIHDTK